jgi:hypothetical protein
MTNAAAPSSVKRISKKGTRGKRPSLAKSLGKNRKKQQHEESAISTMQRLHLLRKQRIFLTKQVQVFEDRLEEIREHIRIIDADIEMQRKLAKQRFDEMEERDRTEVEVSKKGTKPAAKSKKKGKSKKNGRNGNGFELEY